MPRVAGALLTFMLITSRWSSDSAPWNVLIEICALVVSVLVTALIAAVLNGRPTFEIDWRTAEDQRIDGPSLPLDATAGEPSRFMYMVVTYRVVGFVGRFVARRVGLDAGCNVRLTLVPDTALSLQVEKDGAHCSVQTDGLSFELGGPLMSGTLASPLIEWVPLTSRSTKVSVSATGSVPGSAHPGRWRWVRLKMSVEMLRVKKSGGS